MIDVFLPRDKIYVPDMDVNGIVTQVKITTDGVEYLVRFIIDQAVSEYWFYDFEVKRPVTSNA